MSTTDLKSYLPGTWFGIFGEHASVLLPSSEKRRVAALWELVDEGAGFDEVLDALIASGLRDLPAFVLVSAADSVTKVVLRGAARAEFVTAAGDIDLDGTSASTWVERSLDGVESMRITLEETGGPAETLTIASGLVRVGVVEEPATVATVGVAGLDEYDDEVLAVDAVDADEPAGSAGFGGAGVGVAGGVVGGAALGGAAVAAGGFGFDNEQSTEAPVYDEPVYEAEPVMTEPEVTEPEVVEEPAEDYDSGSSDEVGAHDATGDAAWAQSVEEESVEEESVEDESEGLAQDEAAQDEFVEDDADAGVVPLPIPENNPVSFAPSAWHDDKLAHTGSTDAELESETGEAEPAAEADQWQQQEPWQQAQPEQAGQWEQTGQWEQPAYGAAGAHAAAVEEPALPAGDEQADEGQPTEVFHIPSDWGQQAEPAEQQAPEAPAWGQPAEQAPEAPAWGQPLQQAPEPPAWGQPAEQAPEPPAWGQPAEQAPEAPAAEAPWAQPTEHQAPAWGEQPAEQPPIWVPQEEAASWQQQGQPQWGAPAEADHDGLTRAGSYEDQFARQQPGIPGQEQAPSVTAQPVARLQFAHGEVIDVDRAILVGRAPEARRFTSTDQPRLVTVPSPNQEISSTHLEIRPGSGVDHGTAVVTDMGSTNGTVLVQPGLGPEDLQPGVPVQLIPGAVIDLGDGMSIQVLSV